MCICSKEGFGALWIELQLRHALAERIRESATGVERSQGDKELECTRERL